MSSYISHTNLKNLLLYIVYRVVDSVPRDLGGLKACRVAYESLEPESFKSSVVIRIVGFFNNKSLESGTENLSTDGICTSHKL